MGMRVGVRMSMPVRAPAPASDHQAVHWEGSPAGEEEPDAQAPPEEPVVEPGGERSRDDDVSRSGSAAWRRTRSGSEILPSDTSGVPADKAVH